MKGPDMDQPTEHPQTVRDLAEAGAICESCGGVHIPDIDTAILAQDSNLHWCDCEACQPCAEFRAALLRLRDQKPETD